ncbi:MAG TPA: hypothetical protein VGA69_08130 [Nitriliruptorales bacterium]
MKVLQIDTGDAHTCAITLPDDESAQSDPANLTELWCWGDNTYGQAGGSGNLVATPRKVEVREGTDLQGVSTVSAGRRHTCATVEPIQHTSYGKLQDHGYVVCWGANDRGQLGNGSITTTIWRYPRNVQYYPPGIPDSKRDFSGVHQLSAGDDHTCGTTKNGDVWCWGANSYGQVGTGSTADQLSAVWIPIRNVDPSVPDEVPNTEEDDLYNDVVRVAAGGNRTCAVDLGVLYCWGVVVGNGANNTYTQPVRITQDMFQSADVPLTYTPVIDVTTGRGHTCVLAIDATPVATTDTLVDSGRRPTYCWGDNSYRQAGQLSTSTIYKPTQIDTDDALTLDVSAGARMTCEIDGAGADLERLVGPVRCWGNYDHDGRPIADGWLFRQLTVGGTHACAIRDTNEAYCWGSNHRGQLGDATTSGGSWDGPVRPVVWNRPPAVPVLRSPTNGASLVTSDIVLFEITVSDPEGDQMVGTITVRDAATNEIVSEFTTTSSTGGNVIGVPPAPLPPGSYTWSATATDPAGSRRQSYPSLPWSFSVASMP